MADKLIIINRIKKGGGGSHGGAWKVAFADFMTTMMAFFLVMWLMGMSSKATRAGVANYIKNAQFSLLPKGMTGGAPKGRIFQKEPNPEVPGRPGLLSTDIVNELFRQMIQTKISDLQKNILISSRKDWFRIEIIDTEGKMMFDESSSELTVDAKRIVKEIADILRDFGNQILLEGHTDAAQPENPDMTKWSLSSARALAAQNAFLADGFTNDRILGVVGFADTRPIIDDDPNDPRNRRFSVLVICSERLESIESLLLPSSR